MNDISLILINLYHYCLYGNNISDYNITKNYISTRELVV